MSSRHPPCPSEEDHCVSFCVGFGDPDSGPHTCADESLLDMQDNHWNDPFAKAILDMLSLLLTNPAGNGPYAAEHEATAWGALALRMLSGSGATPSFFHDVIISVFTDFNFVIGYLFM
ncbi:hypothetical protein STEG23_034842 [Scotinomys teguina]